jgi:hypothetical protein
MLPDLKEFVETYIGEDIKIQPYQEKLMESLKFKNDSELKIFNGKNDKARVFDYFYTHWKFNSESGQGHMVGQQCEGKCPICAAVEAIANPADFIKREEMTI